MSKVKITTVSGTILEKPVITCFKNNIGTYLVLDNEKNGTMGLPIILVCRLFQGKLSKIIDQGEWQSVKEELKSIIANKTAQYESVPNELNADDVYYTQLTLPVNSFDILKSSYQAPVSQTPAVENNIPETQIPVEPTPIAPVVNEPVQNTPVVENVTQEPVVAPEIPMPDIAPIEPTPVINEQPVVENVEPQSVVSEPPMPQMVPTPTTVVDMPSTATIDPPVAAAPSEVPPLMPEIPMPSAPASVPISDAPVAAINQETTIPTENAVEMSAPEIPMPNVELGSPIAQEQPKMETESVQINSDDIEQIKQTFMQACENMFDALIIKFQK